MPAIEGADLERMQRELLFDGPERGRKLSRFWALLLLAAVIASAGIISDSTATVIGAMIVAPLMTPILGTVLSVVIGDLGNLGRSLGLVAGGAVAVVARRSPPRGADPVSRRRVHDLAGRRPHPVRI